MSDFFDSEVVQTSLAEISYLQNKVMEFVQIAPWAGIDEQLENIATLRLLLDKQENMYNRCSFAGTEDAKELMNEVKDHFKKNGYDTSAKPMNVVFNEVRERVDEIEKDLLTLESEEDAEEHF